MDWGLNSIHENLQTATSWTETDSAAGRSGQSRVDHLETSTQKMAAVRQGQFAQRTADQCIPAEVKFIDSLIGNAGDSTRIPNPLLRCTARLLRLTLDIHGHAISGRVGPPDSIAWNSRLRTVER